MVKLPPDTMSVTFDNRTTAGRVSLASRACTRTTGAPVASKLQVHAAASHATVLPHGSRSAGLCQESSMIVWGAAFVEVVQTNLESCISLHRESCVGTSGCSAASHASHGSQKPP